MANIVPVILIFLFFHNTNANDESTSSLLQVQNDLKNRDVMAERVSPFLQSDTRNDVQKKRSSFVALRGKKFPFGLPLFGLKRASAYIPVRGRRLNLDYLEDPMEDKRASSFYVGRGKKDSSQFLQLYPILEGKSLDGQNELEGYPDSHQSSMGNSWIENGGGGGGQESEDLVRKRAQAFFGARGKRST